MHSQAQRPKFTSEPQKLSEEGFLPWDPVNSQPDVSSITDLGIKFRLALIHFSKFISNIQKT